MFHSAKKKKRNEKTIKNLHLKEAAEEHEQQQKRQQKNYTGKLYLAVKDFHVREFGLNNNNIKGGQQTFAFNNFSL